MNHSQIAAWKDHEDYGCEEPQLVSLIRWSLITKEQEEWLFQHKLSIEDLLNGRTAVSLEEEIHRLFYKPWNDILQANGLKRSFSEDPIGQAMLDKVKDTLGMDVEFK